MGNNRSCKHFLFRCPVTALLSLQRWDFLIEHQEGEGKTEIKGEKNKERDERKLENSRKNERGEIEKWKTREGKERGFGNLKEKIEGREEETEYRVAKNSEGHNKMERVTAINFLSNSLWASSFWKPNSELLTVPFSMDHCLTCTFSFFCTLHF